ncbi:hypothetical protein GCM10022261_07870 [Brevibacterium daeguense]|uniref:DUF2695 domain-containing protein n=1 Tax=Brevibacterium daeguense TaxID=909936 RepID=A0ABP8EH23_9MICO|nr:DUF2695 domain-containing protein [Brevibacterium daeguense]
MNAILMAQEAEPNVRDASAAGTSPADGECLVCFVDRQLAQSGCDGTHRFALSFRDHAAPDVAEFLGELSELGVRRCDCEIFMNAYWPSIRLWRVHDGEDELEWSSESVEKLAPEQMPPCAGVSPGSTQPCSNWERRYRW